MPFLTTPFLTNIKLIWGQFWVEFGSSLDRFGIGFGSIWDRFWVDLGSVWGRFGISLGSFLGRFGQFGCNFGKLGATSSGEALPGKAGPPTGVILRSGRIADGSVT